VGVENELGAVRVCLWILEQADKLGYEGRMEAGVELISEEHRPVGERLNYGADKAEPDLGPKRLVLSVELDVVTYAAVQKTNTEVLERRALFNALGLAFKTGQDPDGWLEPLPHDWVWFVLPSPGDAEIRRSQERKDPFATLFLPKELGSKRLAIVPAVCLGQAEVATEPCVERE
jgi:hypothetical protein